MTITQKEIFVKLNKEFIEACNFIKNEAYHKFPLHKTPEYILAADSYVDLPRLELVNARDSKCSSCQLKKRINFQVRGDV